MLCSSVHSKSYNKNNTINTKQKLAYGGQLASKYL